MPYVNVQCKAICTKYIPSANTVVEPGQNLFNACIPSVSDFFDELQTLELKDIRIMVLDEDPTTLQRLSLPPIPPT